MIIFKKKSAIAIVLALPLSFNVLADDCYTGFKGSSAAQSCSLISGSFVPGSTNYCKINADCHWYSVESGHQYQNNNGTWYIGDVRQLVNNNGRLQVGRHADAYLRAQENNELDNDDE